MSRSYVWFGYFYACLLRIALLMGHIIGDNKIFIFGRTPAIMARRDSFNMRHAMKKSVFSVYDQVRLKPVLSFEILDIATVGIILSWQRKKMR